ncbi:hypothetical protein ACGF07_05120 [Kitasatospora sp. NPDC048194]|uniref:hypothetical protein n=1 Tax=Kitasatospora sp. NPDC048194 TaxID=3364045 RepID=UPI00371D27FF
MLERREIVRAALSSAMEGAEADPKDPEQLSPEHAEDIRKRLAKRYDIPPQLIDSLTGNTAAEISASADRIRAGLTQYRPSGLHTRPVSLIPSGPVDSPPDESTVDPMELAKKVLFRRFSETMR